MTTPEQPPNNEDWSLEADVRRAFESEPGPSPRARQIVMARLNAARANNETGGILARIADWLRVLAVPRWAAAAALLLAMIPTGLFLRQTAEPVSEMPPVTTRGLATANTRLSVHFNPQATDAQIRELLAALGARIVDGPNSGGEYLIEVTAADPAALAQKISAARAHPKVLQSLDLAPP